MKQTTATKSEETNVQSDLEARNSYPKKIRNDDRVWTAMQNRKPLANFWVTYAVISTGDENAKKLVPGKKNLWKVNLSADDISKSGTRRYALHKAENWRASNERKKKRKQNKTRMQSWKLVPWRVPKNSSRFSQHWWRECNPQSRSQGIEHKDWGRKGGKEMKAWVQSKRGQKRASAELQRDEQKWCAKQQQEQQRC